MSRALQFPVRIWITGHCASPAGLNICSEYVFKNSEANLEGLDHFDLCCNVPVFNVICIWTLCWLFTFSWSSCLVLKRKTVWESLFNHLSHLINKCSLRKSKKSSQVRRVSTVGSFPDSVNFITVSKMDSQTILDNSTSLRDWWKCWLSSGHVFGWFDWLLK